MIVMKYFGDLPYIEFVGIVISCPCFKASMIPQIVPGPE